MSGAQSSDVQQPKRVVGRPFQKGQSGNPGGLPKGMADVKEHARKLTPTAMKALEDIAADENQPAAARVSAAVALLDRGWGKAQASVDVTSQGQSLAAPIDRPPNETREQWIERRKRELAHAALLGAPAGSAD